jgi:hypothetical protein
MNLKDGAVYQLPDGRELVGFTTCDNEVLLFSVSPSKPCVYQPDSEGRLICDGKLTAWKIDDLLEPKWLTERELPPAL